MSEVVRFRVGHAAFTMAAVDVMSIQLEIFIIETRLTYVGGDIVIALQATALVPVWFELTGMDAAGNTLFAGTAVWTIDEAAAATKALGDQQAVEAGIHRNLRVRNQIRGPTIIKIAALVFSGYIEGKAMFVHNDKY